MTRSTHTRVAALIAAGLLATTAYGTAYADTTTSGNGSIGGGNQIEADVDAPVNVCGNAVAVLGVAGAECTDGDAEVTEPKRPDDGYEGYDPEEPEPEETPEEEDPREEEISEEEDPPEETPEETPEEEREEQVEEDPQGTEDAADERSVPTETPSAPPADESRLAVTGADQSALTGLVAAAVLAIAAGVGFIFYGRRHKARA
ncbi:chaplin family protein [Nocardiopsis listeri]|uniref:chaplin family protein n=1 Tax=Nocardiopsis listeri TaxID=53440 RepID=UPI000834B8B7|nr:chaplin family protein [Nocardiopsis listeri]